MACIALTKGRLFPCKGGNGGFKAVSFTPWTEGLIVGTAGGLTTMPAGVTQSFRYQLKNAGNTFEEVLTSDSETRSVVYTTTLNVVLQKYDLNTKNEVALLALGEMFVFLEDYNGNLFCIGSENGVELTGGNFNSGGARVDMAGWSLTFTAVENHPFLEVTGAAKTAFAGIVVNGV